MKLPPMVKRKNITKKEKGKQEFFLQLLSLTVVTMSFLIPVKSDDVTEVLHALLVTVIDHIQDLVVHVDHVLDHEIDVEGIGVGLDRVIDEEEVALVLEKEGGGVEVHIEEVVAEVDIGTF